MCTSAKKQYWICLIEGTDVAKHNILGSIDKQMSASRELLAEEKTSLQTCDIALLLIRNPSKF